MGKIVKICLSALLVLAAGCAGSGEAKPEGPAASAETVMPEPSAKTEDTKELTIDLSGKEPITVAKDTFSWDLDGDGTAEIFAVEVIDNGDEAPNVMNFSVYGKEWFGTDLEGGYGLKEAAGIVSEEERKIEMICRTGTFYGADNEIRVYLKLDRDRLVLEAAAE